MANFAIIENGIVTNKIIADSVTDAQEVTGKTCVEYTENNLAYIGLGYNGTTFEQPVVEPTIEPSDEVILLDHVEQEALTE
jgi:hypothetical protein